METKYVDIHAHLADKVFDKEIAALAPKLSDYAILNSGENPEENAKILSQYGHYTNLLPCIGLHPNFISSASRQEVNEGMDFIANNIAASFAVSEIGLDYRGKDEEQKRLQMVKFSELLELAELKNKVCIIHSRKAMNELLEILPSFETKVIIHNFEGNQAHYQKAIAVNAYISISTGFIKFKRDSLLKKLNLERLFVETDSPVLSPDDNINTPLNIPKILKYIADLRGMGEEDLRERILLNFQKLFYG